MPVAVRAAAATHAAFSRVPGNLAATLGIPASAGVTTGAARDTIVCPYNDVDAAADLGHHGRG